MEVDDVGQLRDQAQKVHMLPISGRVQRVSWAQALTPEEIRDAQKKDEELAIIVKWLEGGGNATEGNPLGSGGGGNATEGNPLGSGGGGNATEGNPLGSGGGGNATEGNPLGSGHGNGVEMRGSSLNGVDTPGVSGGMEAKGAGRKNLPEADGVLPQASLLGHRGTPR